MATRRVIRSRQGKMLVFYLYILPDTCTNIDSVLCLFAIQIVASKLRKGVEYFHIIWKGISEQGSTWEPVQHLRGEEAKAALLAFRTARAADLAAFEAKKAAKKAGREPGTAPTPSRGEGGDDEINENDTLAYKIRKSRSSVWEFYHPKVHLDNSEHRGEYAKCKVSDCNVYIKACNTTNLWGHLYASHKKEMKDWMLSKGKVRRPVYPKDLLLLLLAK